MPNNVCRMEVVLTNEDALEAMGDAAELIYEASEDLPWRDDLKEALEKLRYCVNHIGMVEA